MTKIKKKHVIIVTIALMLILIGIFFIQFTSLGYKMTVPLRGYTQAKENIYVDKDFNGDSSKVLSIIDEANKRLATFWGGNTKSKPRIIISDNEKKLKKLGWAGGSTAITTTAVFFGAHSYVVISPRGG